MPSGAPLFATAIGAPEGTPYGPLLIKPSLHLPRILVRHRPHRRPLGPDAGHPRVPPGAKHDLEPGDRHLLGKRGMTGVLNVAILPPMNARIRSLTAAAEARLPGPDQDDLADLMEEFVAARSAPVEFTENEWARLRLIDAEPFIPADPAAVAALFSKRT